MNSTLTPNFTPESAQAFIQSGAMKHVAVIMDGNRRWAQLQNLPSHQGHLQGYHALRQLIDYCSMTLKLPVLTVYAFSTENWRRSNFEVEFLLKLFHQTLQAEMNSLQEKNIRLRFIGKMENFPLAFQKECEKALALTANNTGMLYQVALNYGGRSEIVEACRQIAYKVKSGELQPEEIQEDHIQSLLYTENAFDPDLIIRTGGAYRLSNFLLWQSAYSEIYIVDELWPEFTPEILNRAIVEFQHRQRRFGK